MVISLVVSKVLYMEIPAKEVAIKNIHTVRVILSVTCAKLSPMLFPELLLASLSGKVNLREQPGQT